jgi:prophage regulatory protein
MRSGNVTAGEDQLLTVEEVMKLLRVSRRTVWRWLAEGRLPRPLRPTCVCTRWKASDIRKYLDSLAS